MDQRIGFIVAWREGEESMAVKLIKAGVRPERIAPGKLQQNGRHERLHLTLKQDTAQPPARSLALQIARFERFRHIDNSERPHEALGQVRRVRTRGAIRWRGSEIFISQALTGAPIGLLPPAADVWLVTYGPIVLGTIKGPASSGPEHNTKPVIHVAGLARRAPRLAAAACSAGAGAVRRR